MTIQKDSLIPGRSVAMFLVDGDDSPLRKKTGKIVGIKLETGLCEIKGFDGKEVITEMPIGRAMHILSPKNRRP